MAKVGITDTILRDAHQSQAATRMRFSQMEPAFEKLDKVGYFSLECWGGARFDSCLRFLNEDRWDRLRKLRTKKGLPLAACLPPILVNAVIVGAEVTYIFMPETASLGMLAFNMLTVGIGQAISVGILGIALVRVIEKTPALKRIFTEW